MAELIGGAALGAVVGELLKVVLEETKKTLKFKSLLKRLETTLTDIGPKFNEIAELKKVLNRPEDETNKFVDFLKRGKKLVLKCSKIKVWDVWRKYLHAKKLICLDDELLRFFQMDLQAGLACDSMQSLIGIYDLSDKFDRLVSSVTSRGGGFSGSCSVPGLPDVIIGLDRHLAESKRMLLKDETRVLVISAPGGCGKTTLAKKLCHDDEIKEKFGENIIYVTVSQTSSLKIIAQNLFEHQGKSPCEFQTDEDAKNQIESLIGQMRTEVLLVLDDVWSGSESLIQDLKFQIPGYKILVTSRSLFPRFKCTYELSMLNVEDARTLFRYSAFPSDNIPSNVSVDLVNKMVDFCKGLPLALTVVGGSLCGQPMVKWRTTLKKLADGESILKSNSSLLHSLQISVDALDESSILRQCFFDLGSFPEDDRISGTALMDMWVELYNLDDEGMFASEYLLELSLRNLINLIPIRKDAGEIEGYCSDHYVTQHDLLRELAIYMSGQYPVEERIRLFLEINNDVFPTWWSQQTEHPLNARILSISTDELFSSTWYGLNAPNVEVLILNIRCEYFALPQFISGMSKLKVLIITGYGVYPTQLANLSVLRSLSNLKRIRFEHIWVSNSIQVIFSSQSLKKLAFITCKLGNALQNGGITESPYILPNLTELEIDGCYDLKELLICSVLVRLQKLTITNCHELGGLPRELGILSNLQTFRLHGCTSLRELPDTIGMHHNLNLFDISDCLSISVLPEQIGELSGLRVLNMSGCRGLQKLPVAVNKLSQLEDVICDEETSYLWRNFESELCNVKIHLVEEDRSGSFMKIFGKLS